MLGAAMLYIHENALFKYNVHKMILTILILPKSLEKSEEKPFYIAHAYKHGNMIVHGVAP